MKLSSLLARIPNLLRIDRRPGKGFQGRDVVLHLGLLVVWCGFGLTALARVRPLHAAIYGALWLAVVVLIPYFDCARCCYYGRTCHILAGRLASMLYRRRHGPYTELEKVVVPILWISVTLYPILPLAWGRTWGWLGVYLVVAAAWQALHRMGGCSRCENVLCALNPGYETAVQDSSPAPVGYDWDAFWDVVGSKSAVLKLLYSVHYRQYLRLLRNVELASPRILELGAGIGVIPQRLIAEYGGSAVLVDNNERAYALFEKWRTPASNVRYEKADIFDLDYEREFDLVCSDGLLEHFPDKRRLLEIHRRAMRDDGYAIVWMPADSWLFRLIDSAGPSFGYEEHWSIDELIDLCRTCGLEIVEQVAYFFEVGVLCRRAETPEYRTG